MSIIFLLTSSTSSQTKKITAPSFLAIEMAYLAFCYLSSSVEPLVTKSQLTMRGSIEAQSLIKNTPSAMALSAKFLIYMSFTEAFAQSIISYSYLPPMICM